MLGRAWNSMSKCASCHYGMLECAYGSDCTHQTPIRDKHSDKTRKTASLHCAE